MINQFGNYSLFLALITSVYLVYKSFLSLRKLEKNLDNKIFSAISIQFVMILISFSSLTYAFLVSDFSNQTVFNNSHTDVPILYKFSGTWGNHEGSLLLWLSVLIIFLLIFVINSNNQKISYRLLTIIFQQIIIFGFLLFILFTSNPFISLFPIPKEGQGLNPILQDPALAIHPPVLYLGYVGTSIIFSSALAALVSNNINLSWASYIKKWILVSFIFLTIGILLGSIWAYYELGWGGFWFWDPVENVSLMPWFCLTALLHSIIVLEKRNKFHGWIIILSITTFALSMSGTFLVRSGILNSIHTFANDPSRGVFILCFLFLLIIMSIFIYFFYQKNIPPLPQKRYFFTKETAILINNWFMMFFLSVVLIGTVYPIFLEVINGDKISIGPPFYHKLLIPFLIPFLLFMSIGPQFRWIKDTIKKLDFKIILILISSIFLAYLIIDQTNLSTLYSLPLFGLSIYLVITTLKDLIGKTSTLNQKVSHLGFSLLILSILINGVYSKEFTSNMRVGDERKFLGKIIKLENLEVFENQNFKSLRAKFLIIDKKKIFEMSPEVRIYDEPETITSEADILTTLYSDNFIVFNILKDDGYFNVRYQFKPLMVWIWLSVILISVGSMISLFRRRV